MVDSSTAQFALLLPDGLMLPFDDLANQAISKQLPSFPTGAKVKRVLRVSVQGILQNGRIARDSVRM